MIEPITPLDIRAAQPLKPRRPGRQKGTTPYVAHNALAQAFWKHHIDWKSELATLYIRYRQTGKKNAHELLKVWIALLPYLAVSERYRAEKKLGRYAKKAKVTKHALLALRKLEAAAAKDRPLTQSEQAAYAPDPNAI